MSSKHEHTIPLWGLFAALLALTAAEVALFEVWHRTATIDAAGDPQYFIPKLAMVLLLFVFTVPKALIVLIYFMHLKFEKQFIVLLAIIPFPMVGVAILPSLTDALQLQAYSDNKVEGLGDWVPPHAPAHGGHDASDASDEHAAPGADTDEHAAHEDADAAESEASAPEASEEHPAKEPGAATEDHH